MAIEETSPSEISARSATGSHEPRKADSKAQPRSKLRGGGEIAGGSEPRGSSLRSLRQQRVHDWVVHKLGQRLAGEHRWDGVQVCANPGAAHVRSVQGLWPDLVLEDESGTTLGIYEVETADSVCLAHAEAEWLELSDLGVPFYLVVPAEVEWVAKQILSHLALRPTRLFLY